MSYLTRCNYCSLQDIYKAAEMMHQEVTLQPRPFAASLPPKTAAAIIEHLRPTYGDSLNDGTDVLVGGTFMAWLWVIPDHCKCGDS